MDFEAIKQEVFDAIKECFKIAIVNQARPGEIMVFIARGDYNHIVPKDYNPNTIDTREDFFKETDKQLFLINLRDRRYNFENSLDTNDDPESLFNKMLRRLA